MIIYVSIYKLSTTGGEEMLLSSLLMSKRYHLISSLGLYIIKVFPKYEVHPRNNLKSILEIA